MKKGSRKKSQNKLIAFADNEIMLKSKEYIKSLYQNNYNSKNGQRGKIPHPKVVGNQQNSFQQWRSKKQNLKKRLEQKPRSPRSTSKFLKQEDDVNSEPERMDKPQIEVAMNI